VTAARRTLTDEDVEAIADAIMRKTKPLRARRIEPRELPALTPEERANVRSLTLRKLARPTRKR
jgi:hypothetical protein